MDPKLQRAVQTAAEEHGVDSTVVILGLSDPRDAKLYAETVTSGDPTLTGPLNGVSLGLPVYHIFEESMRAEANPDVWKEEMHVPENLLRVTALCAAVADVRARGSRYAL
jgi:Glycine reductase complex selenoprotein A.